MNFSEVLLPFYFSALKIGTLFCYILKQLSICCGMLENVGVLWVFSFSLEAKDIY